MSDLTIEIETYDADFVVREHSKDKTEIIIDNLSLILSDDQALELLAELDEYLDPIT